MTSEIPSDSETMMITESNKRKFDEIDAVLKKCKLESPATEAFAVEQSNSILTDVTDSESTDSSDHRSDKPVPDCDNEDQEESKDEAKHAAIVCPQYGQAVNRREFRRAGPFILGLKLGHSPVDSIVQYLAKKENTNEFYQLKVLFLHDVYLHYRSIRFALRSICIGITNGVQSKQWFYLHWLHMLNVSTHSFIHSHTDFDAEQQHIQ